MTSSPRLTIDDVQAEVSGLQRAVDRMCHATLDPHVREEAMRLGEKIQRLREKEDEHLRGGGPALTVFGVVLIVVGAYACHCCRVEGRPLWSAAIETLWCDVARWKEAESAAARSQPLPSDR